MKSREEMVLWRMLRRVSDQIRVELDDKDIGRASRVKEYRLKVITVKLDIARQQVGFAKPGMEQVVLVDELKKNPAVVFKRLVEML